MVIGHTDCGVQGMDPKVLLKKLEERGVEKKHMDIIRNSGINLERWLAGFDSVEQSVEDTVFALRNHPLIPINEDKIMTALKKCGVTVHSVHSNVAKIHSRLPAAMEFWLVCLGILAYSCQNTSRDSGV